MQNSTGKSNSEGEIEYPSPSDKNINDFIIKCNKNIKYPATQSLTSLSKFKLSTPGSDPKPPDQCNP